MVVPEVHHCSLFDLILT